MHVKNLIILIAASVISLSESASIHAQFTYTPVKAMPLFSRDTLTICVMGDMMMHSAQIEDALQPDGSYRFDTYFRHLKEKIGSADIAIANMEYTHGGKPYTGYPAFSAPESFSTYLAECGFDIFLCANNHIFDKGSKGAERTLETYRELGEKYGISYSGLASDEAGLKSGQALFILRKGIRTAVVNFTYGTNLGADLHWPKVNYMNDSKGIEQAMKTAAEADFTLVIPHWGEEYELTHSQGQRKTAQRLIELGADMIIGAHPHVVQDFEVIDGVPVVYSLGNAVSNMSARNTQLELMATVSIVRDAKSDMTRLPITFTWLWCSRPGGYCDSYTVLPIEDFIGRKNEWKNPWDYDKMMETYERVTDATGINR